MRKLLLIMVLSVLGCSAKYVDLAECGPKAHCVQCAVRYEYPDVDTKLTYSNLDGVPHVDCCAFVDSKWQLAVLVHMEYKPSIIEFREDDVCLKR